MQECNRNNCDVQCCERYNSQYGYICSECFEELCNVDISILDFMQTAKRLDGKNKEMRKIYLNRIFETECY